MINKLIAGLAAIVTVLVVLLAADRQGFVYVDANGPKVRMQVMGSGSPTVVFETGGGGSLELWGSVPAGVSRFTKIIAYDRAGEGLSEDGIGPRDGRNVATELHAALQNVNAPPPYILVGHSFGGPYIRIFADMYPTEVAGMVLVDPTQEEMIAWNDESGFSRASDRQGFRDATLVQARESRIPSNISVYLIHVMRPWPHGPFNSTDLEEIGAREAPRLPLRLKFHKEWVERIPGGQLVVTENSSHGGINFEEPQLVIDTIQLAIDSARRP